MATERWSSRVGFLLATVGSAGALGNIRRFSAVVDANGGGAYLVPYLLAAFVCAVPLLLLELSGGSALRTDVVSTVLVAAAFAWTADLDAVRSNLDAWFPLAKYVTPPLLVLVTGAKVIGVARPAWRLLLQRAREPPSDFLLAAAVLLAVAAAGRYVRTWR